MKKIKIAIIGCRGIPNQYGGFEQLAQFLAKGLAEKGMDVTVYNSHHHPYKAKSWNGVKIVHRYDAEKQLGTAGQFIYDLNCIRHARKNNFDAWLFLGYTSSSVWHSFFPGNTVILSNMDGLEWKRSKYSSPVQGFLRYAEKLAVRHSHILIADSPVIAGYLENKYRRKSRFIPYGAVERPVTHTPLIARSLNLLSGTYLLVMARLEPENNVAMILEGFVQSGDAYRLVVIGSTSNKTGRALKEKYKNNKNILFAGAVYEPAITHWLRQHCLLYFHGHSVGGTNPSLLEAMGDGAAIAAHANPFNRAVLGDDAWYFQSATEIIDIIREAGNMKTKGWQLNNLRKIREQYNWPRIVEQYHQLITESIHQQQA
ncbi:MAG: DUF1972 domain-containing protein [Ferruginibacter sp.]